MVRMIRMIFIALGVLFTCQAQADLAADLRELRGTISETAKTGKELGDFAGAGKSTEQVPAKDSPASSGLNEGDILKAKIGNVKLFKEPSKKAEVAGSVNTYDEMIYTGEEANGFYSVATAKKGEGWVQKILVKKP